MTSQNSSSKRVRNDYEEVEDGKPKKIPKTLAEKSKEKRLVIILENASLETVKVRECDILLQEIDVSFFARLVENLNF